MVFGIGISTKNSVGKVKGEYLRKVPSTDGGLLLFISIFEIIWCSNWNYAKMCREFTLTNYQIIQMFSQTMLKWKCRPKYFVNMVRNTVKNAILDLHILLKIALKMQEIPFQSAKIETFSGRASPLTALEFSDFAQGWPRSGQMSGTRKFQLCRPPWEMTTLRHWWEDVA